MEMTSYTVKEDERAMVEVCAFVHSPNDARSNCPIQFPFNVAGLATNNNGTAGNTIHRSHDKINLDNIWLFAVSYEDYVAVSNFTLVFDRCQRKSCVNLTIVNDDVLEMVESFTVSLGNPNPNNSIQTEDRFAHLASRISIDPETAEIHIIDNDSRDCTYVYIKIKVTTPILYLYRSYNWSGESSFHCYRGCGYYKGVC